MPLTQNELAVLRRQYPAEHYNIKEQAGKLEVIAKKTVIRVFKQQLKKINASLINTDTFNEALAHKLETTQLSAADFEQAQITIEKKTADLLSKNAKKCKTRKVVYLQRLLEAIK